MGRYAGKQRDGSEILRRSCSRHHGEEEEAEAEARKETSTQHRDSKQKSPRGCLLYNKSLCLRRLRYDTYTMPTCDLCVTSTPALAIKQTPTRQRLALPEVPIPSQDGSCCSEDFPACVFIWMMFLYLSVCSTHADTHTHTNVISLPIYKKKLKNCKPSPDSFCLCLFPSLSLSL